MTNDAKRTRGRAVLRRATALAALLACAAPGAARADLIKTLTIDPVTLDDPGSYPSTLTIGTFTWTVPAIGTLVSAMISGAWGTSFLSPTTAPGIYTLAGATVFTCNVGDNCYGSDSQTAWSFNGFTPGQLTALNTGSAVFAVSQSDLGNVNVDTTTLVLDYNVPEPASLALFGAALLSTGLMARRNRT